MTESLGKGAMTRKLFGTDGIRGTANSRADDAGDGAEGGDGGRRVLP